MKTETVPKRRKKAPSETEGALPTASIIPRVGAAAHLSSSYFSAMAISFQTRFYSLIAPASPVPPPAEHPAAFFAAEAALPGTGFFSSSASSRMEYR